MCILNIQVEYVVFIYMAKNIENIILYKVYYIVNTQYKYYNVLFS